MSETDKYEIGYKKPPKSGQFKKGKSGNPLGALRRKKDKHKLEDPHHALAAQLAIKIEATIGGKKIKLSKQEAYYAALIAKAVGGNVPAMKLLEEKINELPSGYKNPAAIWYRITEEHEKRVQRFIQEAERYIKEKNEAAGNLEQAAQPIADKGNLEKKNEHEKQKKETDEKRERFIMILSETVATVAVSFRYEQRYLQGQMLESNSRQVQ